MLPSPVPSPPSTPCPFRRQVNAGLRETKAIHSEEVGLEEVVTNLEELEKLKVERAGHGFKSRRPPGVGGGRRGWRGGGRQTLPLPTAPLKNRCLGARQHPTDLITPCLGDKSKRPLSRPERLGKGMHRSEWAQA